MGEIGIKQVFSCEEITSQLEIVNERILCELYEGVEPEKSGSSSSDDEEEDNGSELDLNKFRPYLIHMLIQNANGIPIGEHERKLEATVQERGMDSDFTEKVDLEGQLDTLV